MMRAVVQTYSKGQVKTYVTEMECLHIVLDKTNRNRSVVGFKARDTVAEEAAAYHIQETERRG